METESYSERDPRRASAVVLASIACGAMTLISGVFLFLVATTSGASSMAVVLPYLAFVGTGWIWVILALVAMFLSRRLSDSRLPITLAGITLFEAFLCLILTLSASG
jgi:hypothetical protein